MIINTEDLSDLVKIETLVAKNLIEKRNHRNCDIQEHFDAILKHYFLTGDEFQKHVIEGEEL